MNRMLSFTIVALIWTAITCPAQKGGGRDSREIVLATTPSGEFRLVWREPHSAIEIVTENERLPLPPVQVQAHEYGNWASGLKDVSSEQLTEMPLAFISPNERWIFVQLPVEASFTAGCLYERVEGAGKKPRYKLASAERLDLGAWHFFAQERKVQEQEIGIPDKFGNRSQYITFGAWGADSGRLLIRLKARISSRTNRDFFERDDAGSWLCYFNTLTSTFERTERLSIGKDGAVLSAELIAQEGPETPATERFTKSDEKLNKVYGELAKHLGPAAKAALQEEERDWLKKRDLFAAIHANQSWSLFPGASEIEGRAIATEQRVAELEKRINQ